MQKVTFEPEIPSQCLSPIASPSKSSKSDSDDRFDKELERGLIAAGMSLTFRGREYVVWLLQLRF
jgi:hypothetical protein